MAGDDRTGDLAREARAPVLTALLAAGVVRPRDAVDDGLRTRVLDRSNHVSVVLTAGTPTFVAKTGRPGAEQWEQGSPALERAMLAAPRPPRAVDVLPEVVAIVGDLLVTRFVADGASISEQVRDGRLPRGRAARLVGRALGRLVGWDPPPALPPAQPWGVRLLVDPPPRFVNEHPPALALRDELARDDVLVSALRVLAGEWRPTALVHGDVRWDNCLVDPARPCAVLVDWETAGLGDPAWDVACAVAEHLVWGPFGPEAGMPPTSPAGVAAAVDRVGPELAALAAAFADAGGKRSQVLLARAVRLVAARLVHVAFQWTYWDGDQGAARARAVSAAAAVLLVEDGVLRRWLAAPGR